MLLSGRASAVVLSADKSPKNGDFRERGKYVANGAIGNSNSVASDENILWADERCAVCLTSRPAGSFVRVRRGKARPRAYIRIYTSAPQAHACPCLCASWVVEGDTGWKAFIDL